MQSNDKARWGRAALARWILGCGVLALGLSGTSGAQATAWQAAATDDIVPGAVALVAEELSQARGAGLDSQPPSSPGPSGGIAVILWDDFPDGEVGSSNGIVGAGNANTNSAVGSR